MLEITIKDETLDQIAQQTGDKISSVLGRAVMAGAEIIKREASSRAPRRTGKLADNMRALLEEQTEHTATAVVKPGKYEFYGRFYEYGARAHIIAIKNKNIGKIKVLTNRQDFFGLSVVHPGTKKRPFLRPAEQAKGEEVRRAIENTIYAALGR
jgi:HK97 gp10 family phage protein